EIGAFAGEEAGLLAVSAPVLDVELAVADVEVAGDEGERIVVPELSEPGAERLEELPLLFLLRSLGFSGVHVGAHHSKRPVAEEEVGLEPAALRIEVLGAELGAVRERGGAAGDSDARSSL